MSAEGVDDKSNFKILKSALEDIGLNKSSTQMIWQVLGAILLIGNLDFDNKENLSSESNLCRYSD